MFRLTDSCTLDWPSSYQSIVFSSKSKVFHPKGNAYCHLDSCRVCGFDNQVHGDFTNVGDAGNFAESHDFAATNGLNIVIDETAERGISVKRQRIRELDSEPISEPKLHLPLSSVSLLEDIGPSTGNVGKSVCSLCTGFRAKWLEQPNTSNLMIKPRTIVRCGL
ncbi:hypothetical protein Tco_0296564, partial [Tanacetum coccineum]